MSSTHRGWKYDATNGRLAAQYNGTEVFDFDANDIVFGPDLTVTFGCTVTGTDIIMTGPCGYTAGVSGASGGVAGVLKLRSTGSCGDAVIITTAACSDWTLTLPTNNGNCGQQLATNGCGVTSWAAACSSIETKDILGPTCKHLAYDRVLNTTIYDYTYKPGYGLKSKVPYTGPVAEEAPFLMRGGQAPIFSDINGFGHLTAAFQVLAEKVEKLEARETCKP